jgi:hypothetical protein
MRKERDMKRPNAGVAAAAVVAAAFATMCPPSWAQEATAPTTTETTTSTLRQRVPPTTATPEMISEAIERSKARTQRFQSTGVPEQFGSEEPFTFSSTK